MHYPAIVSSKERVQGPTMLCGTQRPTVVESACSSSSSVDARQVPLPVYCSKLEVLAVFIHGARRNALVIVFYWPGSAEISNAFFEDFDDVLERSATFACPVIILGYVSIHLEVANDNQVPSIARQLWSNAEHANLHARSPLTR